MIQLDLFNADDALPCTGIAEPLSSPEQFVHSIVKAVVDAEMNAGANLSGVAIQDAIGRLTRLSRSAGGATLWPGCAPSVRYAPASVAHGPIGRLRLTSARR
jgi:hypothetical protein